MAYTVGETSERTGFTVETLRYYERIELVTDVPRDASGHRSYDDDHLNWLSMLRCLRDTGMPIQAMCAYARSSRESGTEPERLTLLRDHAQTVDEQIAMLQEQRQHLAEKIAWYERELADSSLS